MKTRLAALVCLIPVVVAPIPWALWWDRLPNEVAIHWGLGGTANASMSRSGDLVLTLGITVALGIVGAALAVSRHHLSAVFGAGAAIFAWVSWAGVLANRDHADWHRAHLPLIGGLPAVLPAVGLAWVIWKLEPPLLHHDANLPRPTAGLKRGEQAAWSTTIGWSPLVFVLPVVVGIVLGVATGSPAAILPIVIVAVAFSEFVRIRVSADRRGLIVRYGWLPWPRTHIPLDDITGAHAIDLHPLEWGGWGYRRRPGMRAVVLHHGPALQVDLKNAKRFAITVADPETPAGLLNDMAK